MPVNAKKVAFGGLMLALTEVCIALGSIIESNTCFLLAAASFFVGIVVRETNIRSGAAFYMAGVLLGVMIAPNKIYVLTYAAMGFYILAIEVIWRWLGRLQGLPKPVVVFWSAKYLIFNIMFIPIILGGQRVLFGKALSRGLILGIFIFGQIGLYVYDKAYEYVQAHIWSKVRKKI